MTPGPTSGDRSIARQPHPHLPARPATGPLLLWLLIQIAALALPALRVPLAAKYPQPAELLAPQVLFIAQISAASLLFPFLLRDGTTSVAVIATAWSFAAFAAMLSALPAARAAAGAGYVSLWLAGLAVWRAVLPSLKLRLYGAAVTALVSIGCGALWYLAMEFNPATATVGRSGGGSPWALGPLTSAARVIEPGSPPPTIWILPVTSLGLALGTLVLRHAFGRAKLSTGPAPDTSPDTSVAAPRVR